MCSLYTIEQENITFRAVGMLITKIFEPENLKNAYSVEISYFGPFLRVVDIEGICFCQQLIHFLCNLYTIEQENNTVRAVGMLITKIIDLQIPKIIKSVIFCFWPSV